MLKFCPENPCKAANFWPRYPSNPNFGGFKNFLFLRNIFGYPILGFLTPKSTKQAWQNHFCHQKYDQITNLYVEIFACLVLLGVKKPKMGYPKIFFKGKNFFDPPKFGFGEYLGQKLAALEGFSGQNFNMQIWPCFWFF